MRCKWLLKTELPATEAFLELGRYPADFVAVRNRTKCVAATHGWLHVSSVILPATG